MLRERTPNAKGVGCFLCKLILEDLEDNGELNGRVLDSHNHPYFPPEGELSHLRLEGIPFQEEDIRAKE